MKKTSLLDLKRLLASSQAQKKMIGDSNHPAVSEPFGTTEKADLDKNRNKNS
jgi:hypothetical protein